MSVKTLSDSVFASILTVPKRMFLLLLFLFLLLASFSTDRMRGLVNRSCSSLRVRRDDDDDDKLY